jgi:nucleoside-diphosphate-sugar epimerase
MGEDRLHVVFGTGQVGSALAAHLASLGIPVRTVSRHRPAELAGGTGWRAADVTDPEAAADAAKGASVVYQCVNAPYTQWPELFPPLQRGVLTAAQRTGALLVVLENLYGYGPAGGKPMTEDLPLAATTVKGRTRAAMTAELLAAAEAGRVRLAIGRASDFSGPGVTQGSVASPAAR